MTVDPGLGPFSAPPLVFGAMARRDQSDQARIEILRAAFELGMTTIDTAPLYGFGAAERHIAQAFDHVEQSNLQVLTKVGLRWDDDSHGEVMFEFTDEQGKRGAVRKNSRPESICLEVERSLERLQRTTLDLVQIHQPDIHTPFNESIGALKDLVREGKIRRIGISNFSPDQVRVVQKAMGDVPLASIQQDYSLLERRIEAELLPLCQRDSIALLAYSPLAGGHLARPTDGSSSLLHRRLYDGALAPVAKRHGVEPRVIALAWVCAQSGVTSAIVGASSVAQVAELATVRDITLSDEDLKLLAKYSKLTLGMQLGRLPGRVKGKVQRALRRSPS